MNDAFSVIRLRPVIPILNYCTSMRIINEEILCLLEHNVVTPEDGILHNHPCVNLKSHVLLTARILEVIFPLSSQDSNHNVG
jgi:hypothetical protein